MAAMDICVDLTVPRSFPGTLPNLGRTRVVALALPRDPGHVGVYLTLHTRVPLDRLVYRVVQKVGAWQSTYPYDQAGPLSDGRHLLAPPEQSLRLLAEQPPKAHFAAFNSGLESAYDFITTDDCDWTGFGSAALANVVGQVPDAPDWGGLSARTDTFHRDHRINLVWQGFAKAQRIVAFERHDCLALYTRV